MTDFQLEYREPENADMIFSHILERLDYIFSSDMKSVIGKNVGIDDFQFSSLTKKKNHKFLSKISRFMMEDFDISEYDLIFTWYSACYKNNTSIIKLLSFMTDNNYDKDVMKTWSQIIEDDPISSLFFNDDEKPRREGVIVCHEIGDLKGNEGRSLKSRYEDIIGNPLEFKGKKKAIEDVYNTFLDRFPWAKNTLDVIFGQLYLNNFDNRFKLPNILVYGAPGCGKTKLLSELVETFEMTYGLYPCGGSNDSSGLLPVARGWSTSRACGPVQLMLQDKCCNPVLILDEIEKAQQTSAKNTTLSSALLSMMSGNGVYYDTCLQANVDLSYVSFTATANNLSGLPEPLLDRFFVVEMASPTVNNFDSIMDGIIASESKRLGVRDSDLPVLEDWEVDTLKIFLEGSKPSIRSLEKSYRLIIGAKIMKNKMGNKNNENSLLDKFF